MLEFLRMRKMLLELRKRELVMEGFLQRWGILGLLLMREVKTEEDIRFLEKVNESLDELLRKIKSGEFAVLPSPVEEKREEREERTIWGEEEKERIKASVSPLLVYERYVGKIARRGTNYSLALCPFHPDHKPSLAIYEERFYCYGCGWKGDIFSFLMKREGIGFREAVEKIIKDFSLKSPVERLERGGKGEGIDKSIVSLSERPLRASGGGEGGEMEGWERKREGGKRGLTFRQYKDYCGIIGEELMGMGWREFFCIYGQLDEGLWFFKEKKFISVAEPFSKYKEAIERGEAIPCIKFEVWDLNEEGEIDYFPERLSLRYDAPGGFHYGKGTKAPLYGLHLFLSDFRDRPILICEGASDGLLSILLGFIPFSLPGKGSWKLAVEYLPKILKRYGERPTFILVEPDAKREMAELYRGLKEKGIKAFPFSPQKEKDLRDWWIAFVKKRGRAPSPKDFEKSLKEVVCSV